jgi:hypothetical protein
MEKTCDSVTISFLFLAQSWLVPHPSTLVTPALFPNRTAVSIQFATTLKQAMNFSVLAEGCAPWSINIPWDMNDCQTTEVFAPGFSSLPWWTIAACWVILLFMLQFSYYTASVKRFPKLAVVYHAAVLACVAHIALTLGRQIFLVTTTVACAAVPFYMLTEMTWNSITVPIYRLRIPETEHQWTALSFAVVLVSILHILSFD